MSSLCFLYRRMLTGALPLGAYGLVVAWTRLPASPAGPSWSATALTATGLFAAVGMVFAVLFAGGGLLAARLVPERRRPLAAAAVEALLAGLFAAWLLINEVVYVTTSEVFSYDTFLLVWHNTAAVFQNAWRMAPVQLVLLGALPLAALGVLYVLSRRSFRRLYAPATAPSAVGRPKRAFRIVSWLSGPLVVAAGIVAWQLDSGRSEALTRLYRSTPPLRALNLGPSLSDLVLAGPPPVFPGDPLITEAEYRSSLGGPRMPAPNVVFILLESVSAKALHCYGYPREDITPNLDRLAAEGTLFEHCLGAASFSVYGLTSIMTSLHMLRADRFDHFTDTSFPFLGFPRALKLAGYELALFSSGNESFDNIRTFYPKEDFDVYYSQDTCGVPQPDCMRMDDKYAVGEFERWMAARRDERPFYCGFYLQSTHFNYEVPEPWASHYLPVPPLYSNGDGILQIPPDVLPKLKNQYDNAMRYSDHWVGRIRDALQRAGVLDNTVIVVIADHGEAFMEHGLARHAMHVWEEMIHIPLIVWVGPTVRAALGRPLPSRVPDTVSGVDVAPTIAGLVGIRPHPSWQGCDILAPDYTGRDRPVFFLTQYTRWQEGVCLNGMKYICDLTDMREHLFDLRADPGERHDLIAVQRDLAAAMRRLLGGWHRRQLAYYSHARRPFTHYIGRYEPGEELLSPIRAAAD